MEKKLDGLVALLTGAQSISSSAPNSTGNSSSAANLSDQEQAAIGLANLAPSLSRLYGRDGDGNPATSLVNDTQMPDFNVGDCLSALKTKDDECQSRRQQRQDEEAQQQPRPDVDCSTFNFMMPPPSSKLPLEDVIGRNLVTEDEADKIFTIFADMSTHFPFYVIPSTTTVATLRRERPVLLLAMLCTASGTEKRIQMALERDFRKVFSERVIMNGEKSLELLQAGLIYLSWFQCHFSPKTQIFLQMMHIFISLVTDLGYDRKPDKEKGQGMTVGGGMEGNAPSPRYSDSGSEPVLSPEKQDEKELRSREIRRAFLGCWWLSNSLSIDFRKRIPLHFSSYMRRCLQTFIDRPEFESDKYMVMMVRLQKFQEDVCETFRYHDQEVAGKQDLLRIQMSLKAFQSQLKDMEREIQYLDPRYPASAENLPTLNPDDAIYPTVYVMGMYMYEIGLHMTPPPPSAAPFVPTASLEYTSERISILSECLMYTKKFLDCMTSRDASSYRKMTSPSWMRISYALVVLSKLALGGTEPVDLCNIKEKTVIQYSNRQFTTLNPHPAIAAEAARLEESQRLVRSAVETQNSNNRSPSPDNRPPLAFIPSPSNVDGWDTSVVRAAVKMEFYLDRMVELCKCLHVPPKPVREEDRERYKSNGVEENAPPDLYDFGMWMFGTMKEWYLAMVRREEEIEDAVRDAVSATPGSGTVNGSLSGPSTGSGSSATGSGTPGGSVISGAMVSSRTRSTSVSIMTPTGSTLEKEWSSPNQSMLSLLKKYEADKAKIGGRGMNGVIGGTGGGGGGGGEYGSPGSSGMQGNNGVNNNAAGGAEDVQMQGQVSLPPSIGFDFMDPVGDDFWGAMWSSWPLFYPGA
ncbi:hypothetical protein ABW20_dc0104945 [Dactylellina cionopaga]|nr:hypothetical protein ABW20_dc0104945 [Dactylellina cionopaga]